MSKPVALLKAMRPRQWTKNLIVFAPLIFAGRIADISAILASLFAFALFCLASGAIYLLNDLRDLERDRLHQQKRTRPIASGELAPSLALAVAIALLVVVVPVAFFKSTSFGLATLAYVGLQGAYMLWLKNLVILDVMSIAGGFLLRATAGAAAVGVDASPWLYVCAALLALFLGFGKRRHELLTLEERAGEHRAVLNEYSAELLDTLLSTVTAATIIAYSLYAFFSPTAVNNHYLMLTVPFVIYGVFRYVYLMHKRNLGGSPEEILLTDVPLILTIVGWLIAAGAVIYLT